MNFQIYNSLGIFLLMNLLTKKDGEKLSMSTSQIFFLTDKNQITIPFNKHCFERSNTKDDLDTYLLKAYLRFYCTVSGRICTTLDAITSGCGYSIKCNSRISNEKFRLMLLSLQQDNLIYCDKDLRDIKNSEYFELQLQNNDIFYCDKNFVSLTMKEYETIINSKTTTKKNILLATYLCIKKHIYNNTDTPAPQLSIPSNESIKKATGVSSVTTVKSAISELKKLGMIYCSETIYYYKDVKSNTYMQTRNVYALDQRELIHTKRVLTEFYQSNVYAANEMDADKIMLVKRKKHGEDIENV